MPYVKWMLGAEDLTPEDDMPIGRNVLELNDVRQSANYTCVAMSTLGVIEAIAQITVKGISQAHLFRHSSVFHFIHSEQIYCTERSKCHLPLKSRG